MNKANKIKIISVIMIFVILITLVSLSYAQSILPFVNVVKNAFVNGIATSVQIGHVFTKEAFKQAVSWMAAGNSWRLFLSTGARFLGVAGALLLLADLATWLINNNIMTQETLMYKKVWSDGCSLEITKLAGTSTAGYYANYNIDVTTSNLCDGLLTSGDSVVYDVGHNDIKLALKKNGQEVVWFLRQDLNYNASTIKVRRGGYDEGQYVPVGAVVQSNLNENALNNALNDPAKVAQIQNILDNAASNATIVTETPANSYTVNNPSIVNNIPSYLPNTQGKTIDQTTGQAITPSITVQQAQDMTEVSIPNLPENASLDTGITIPEKQSIPSLVQSFISNHPLINFINTFRQNIQITEGACQFPISFMGSESVINFCQYESLYGVIGAVLVAFASLSAALIIIKT